MMKASEAVAKRCSVKKVFLEISQNSQENTCGRIFFFNAIKLVCKGSFQESNFWSFTWKAQGIYIV